MVCGLPRFLIRSMCSQYLNNYSNALQTVSTLHGNHNFQQFLAAKRKDCGGLDLMSFLIMPVQRIPRYEMLLRELNKYTPADHPQAVHLDEVSLLTVSFTVSSVRCGLVVVSDVLDLVS